MLWHKAWTDTRWRFLIGLGLLSLSALSTVYGYPMLARKLVDIVTPEHPDSMVGRAIRDSLELARTFRGYVWMNGFRQNFAQMATLFAVLLGSGGLRTDGPGTLFTLSLPASRRRLTTTRAAVGLAELFALGLAPALLVWGFAPAIGEQYALADALVHGLCLFVAATAFFSLTTWLATTSSDIWRPGLLACGVALMLGLCEALFDDATWIGPFHTMAGGTYFRDGRLPWAGLALAGAFSWVMLHRAVAGIEHRDF